MIARILPLVLAASSAVAGPLSPTYKPVGASNKQWLSPAMSFADADRAWRDVVDTPGCVAVIVDWPSDVEADDEPKPPLTLATARVALSKMRGKKHRKEWAAFDRALATATISPADRDNAAKLVAADMQPIDDGDNKPQKFYVLVVEGTVGDVVAMFDGYNGSPSGRELVPLLAAWHEAYGARPYEWTRQFTFDVPRPPTRLRDGAHRAEALGLLLVRRVTYSLAVPSSDS